MSRGPIINCHTHIFTGDHVPPFLAKSYLPWPLYYILHLRAFVYLFRLWYKYPARIPYTVPYKKAVRFITDVRKVITMLYPLGSIIWLYLFLFVLYLLFRLLAPESPPTDTVMATLKRVADFLAPYFPRIQSTWASIVIVAVILIVFRSIRAIVITLAKNIWKLLSKLPGPETRELFRRYLNIGRYAFHEKQNTIFSKLRSQYPKRTGFVVLPMDMEYMQAGKTKVRYRDQMAELAHIKSKNKLSFYPFVFADPRRMVEVKNELRFKEGDKPYFKWDIINGSFFIDDCFVKEYIEEHRFSGIKIYPALGYYPFDAKLLPLWKYCVDNNLPVLTHCIRGTIFYRGRKKPDWNYHPVFKQAMGKERPQTTTSSSMNAKADGYPDVEIEEQETSSIYEALVLPQSKNVDFSYNFTHPLNYLCLLEEELLRQVVTLELQRDPASKLGAVFGYNGPDAPMDHDLRALKICFGHFGGDDEWRRYFDKDRYNYSSQLAKHTDWYSIICSMMLQFPNVYADISYILHDDPEILPLLKQTLLNKGMCEKVLYGTDFFVVRNHKSDKQMLADMLGGLSESEFDQIARVNPKQYLRNRFMQGKSVTNSNSNC
jgi:predicted TIM-barrel fold metal-dependent hydrolase